MVEWYLSGSPALHGVVHLVDGRHPPSALDLEMMTYLGELGIPTLVVLTKMDRVARGKVRGTVEAASKILRVDPESAGEPDTPSSREEEGSQEGEHPPGGDPSDLPVVFSDNFFDLLPGRPRTVSLVTALPLAEVQSGLRIRTLAEVPREGFPSEMDPVPEPRPDTARVGIEGTGHR